VSVRVLVEAQVCHHLNTTTGIVCERSNDVI
jgi:hypothetical protein